MCSACRSYDKRQAIDWEARHHELRQILLHSRDTHPHAPYDCVVPSSGGKDSTYQAITLIEHGARPLIVTATTCHLTELGRANIDNLARFATTIEVTPNRHTRAHLNRIGLLEVGDPSWPEHASIFTTPFRVAAAFGIPLIFYGESPQNQYGGPPGSEEGRRMTKQWVDEHGGFLGLRADDLSYRPEIRGADLADYRLPSPEAMAKVEAYFLGQFIPWDSHRNAEVAIRWGLRYATPTPANWWAWENLDNAQTGIHDFLCYLKYGLGRGCAQISVDIRAGRISRTDALDWVREHDGHYPWEYAGVDSIEILERMGTTTEELTDALARFTNRELFAGEVNCRPILKEFA